MLLKLNPLLDFDKLIVKGMKVPFKALLFLSKFFGDLSDFLFKAFKLLFNLSLLLICSLKLFDL